MVFSINRSGCCAWGGRGRNEMGGRIELKFELSSLQGDAEKQQVQPTSNR